MRRKLPQARQLALALFLMSAASLSAAAQSSTGWIDEGKLGVLAHDVAIFGDHIEKGVDINGELLFTSPDIFKIIGSPRPALGVTVNTANKTDFAYLDLAWTATLWRDSLRAQDAIYLGGSLGGAVHDGNLDRTGGGKKALGTRALYHLAAELGYQITPTNSLEVYFSHASNANAARRNGGMNELGLRTGFKF